VHNRTNPWDGIDIFLDAMNLKPNHHCSVEAEGYIANDSKKYVSSYVEISGLPSYEHKDSHRAANGRDFKLIHTFPITGDESFDNIRIASRDDNSSVLFVINGIKVLTKPFSVDD